jgi:Holliday junction resolvase RusA-like endonuclease
VISFTVYGNPAPKGSMKAFMRPGCKFPIVTHDNTRTRPWSEAVKWAAKEQVKGDEIAIPEGPIQIDVQFYMPRPKSCPKFAHYHTKRPDLDKLLRCVEDALTGIVWKDDAQVCSVTTAKFYTAGDLMPQANIKVSSI